MTFPILQWHRITKDYRELLPKASGVYVMTDATGTPIYIGQSTNLAQRVSSSHQNYSYAKHICFAECPKDDRLELEKSLINHYKPSLNVTYKFINTDGNTWV